MASESRVLRLANECLRKASVYFARAELGITFIDDDHAGTLFNMTRLGHGKFLPWRQVTRLADIVGGVRINPARPLALFQRRLDLAADLPSGNVDPVLIGHAPDKSG